MVVLTVLLAPRGSPGESGPLPAGLLATTAASGQPLTVPKVSGGQTWREEVAFAEGFLDRSPDLGTLGHMRDGTSLPLRDVLVHMIEEYARHCGHADLLRECIDGRVGQ